MSPPSLLLTTQSLSVLPCPHLSASHNSVSRYVAMAAPSLLLTTLSLGVLPCRRPLYFSQLSLSVCYHVRALSTSHNSVYRCVTMSAPCLLLTTQSLGVLPCLRLLYFSKLSLSVCCHVRTLSTSHNSVSRCVTMSAPSLDLSLLSLTDSLGRTPWRAVACINSQMLIMPPLGSSPNIGYVLGAGIYIYIITIIVI